MPGKRNINDTMPMVPISPVALGGVPRECATSTDESASAMRARIERAVARIMASLRTGRVADR